MNLGIDGKVAFVTAASQGLGKATALSLARQGAQVAICARNQPALEQAAKDIRDETGCSILTIECDLKRADDITRAMDRVSEQLGAPDILVTNCGGPKAGPPQSFSDSDWHDAFEQVFLSAVRLIRRATPHMKATGWGRVVCITSVSVLHPLDHLVLSNTMRSAVVSFAKTMSNELAAHGVTINTVAPGPFDTERSQTLLRNAATSAGITVDEAVARWGLRPRIGRPGNPAELATVITFLCSQLASFVTGAVIPVDGGIP